jgi:hypothetical protein
MYDIQTILEGIYNVPELRRRCVPMFISNPGIGKSTEVYAFAESKGVNVIPFILGGKPSAEVSGILMPDMDKKQLTYWEFDKLIDAKDGDIVFLDEAPNASAMVLNAILTLVEDRITPSGKKLADVMFVAAGNPQAMHPMTPAQKERFIWYRLEFDSESQKKYSKYLMETHLVTESMAAKVCKLVKNETFVGENFSSGRSLDKAISMCLYDVPTPYTNRLESILREPIENNTTQTIMCGEYEFLPGRIEAWIDLARHSKRIKV